MHFLGMGTLNESIPVLGLAKPWAIDVFYFLVNEDAGRVYTSLI